MRKNGVTCLLLCHKVQAVRAPSTSPLRPQVNLRRGGRDLAVTGVDLNQDVRWTAARLPAVTVAALPCQSPFSGKNIDDLQTTRRNNVLIIDADIR